MPKPLLKRRMKFINPDTYDYMDITIEGYFVDSFSMFIKTLVETGVPVKRGENEWILTPWRVEKEERLEGTGVSGVPHCDICGKEMIKRVGGYYDGLYHCPNWCKSLGRDSPAIPNGATPEVKNGKLVGYWTSDVKEDEKMTECCYIGEGSEECKEEAIYIVWNKKEPFYDHFTHACIDHLGHLIDDSPETIVYALDSICQCDECKIRPHASDCAVHNQPAMEKGSCNCGSVKGV